MSRTNIDIDDEVMAKAMAARPGKTKRAIVEEGLNWVVQMHNQSKIRELRGKLHWEGDLDEMRSGRVAEDAGNQGPDE